MSNNKQSDFYNSNNGKGRLFAKLNKNKFYTDGNEVDIEEN